jgi:PEP-CTERM motif
LTVPGIPDPISGGDLILATFSSPVSSIRVFSNLDHTGASFDGYQYSIFGSNGNNSWTSLFDATSVSGAGEPFTLTGSTGTAPTTVNNISTGACQPTGCVGYEADFSFNNAYQQYAFGPSTVAIASGNVDQELSGVAAIPEPKTYAMLLVGLGLIGFTARRKKDIEV